MRESTRPSHPGPSMRLSRTAAALVLCLGGASAFLTPVAPRTPAGLWGAVAAPRTVLYAAMQDEALSSTIEKGANSTVTMFVTVPGSMTRKAYDDAVKKLLNDPSVRLPGFRKGQKVPEQVLLNALGGKNVLVNEALDLLCEDALKKAIDQSGVKAVGQASLQSHPQTLIESYKPGDKLVMEVKVDVYPEVVFKGDYKGLKVSAERVPLEDEKVKTAIDALLKKRLKLVDTAEGYQAQTGDSCIVNMKAYQVLSDGTRGPEMRNIAAGEGVEVVLEPGRFLPGVVENLVGAKAGETRVVSVTFPDQVRDQKLAGLKAEFDIEVLSVKNRVVPQLDDEFAASIREGLTAEDVKKEVIDAVNSDAEQLTKANRDRALENALLEIVEADVPETWIIEESRRKFASMMQEFSAQGKSEEEVKAMVTKENFEKYREISMPGTLRTLRLGAAVAQIAEREALAVDPVELQDQCDLRRLEAERQGMDEKTLRDQLEAKMLADMVMELLASHADITYTDRVEA